MIDLIDITIRDGGAKQIIIRQALSNGIVKDFGSIFIINGYGR
jgi:hypothetical protein